MLVSEGQPLDAI